jgi:hypothetical protein
MGRIPAHWEQGLLRSTTREAASALGSLLYFLRASRVSTCRPDPSG